MVNVYVVGGMDRISGVTRKFLRGGPLMGYWYWYTWEEHLVQTTQLLINIILYIMLSFPEFSCTDLRGGITKS